MDAKASNVSGDLAKVFLVGSLDAEKSLVVARTCSMGLMLANPSITTQIRPRAHFVPTAVVFAVDGISILSSIYSTKTTVKIWDLVDPKMDGAPTVKIYCSRE
ncbi:hypothetical protein NC651_030483 [Populus alba x Populus x berolinensis]|nr:hypothetical protein NC651_030483 [Populus alba x Populus x berolinensis]